MRKPVVKDSGRVSPRNRSVRATAYFGALAVAATLAIPGLGGAILNGYGKKEIEQAYARAHPGSELRIGKLDYEVGANRLAARSVTLSGTNSTLTAEMFSLTGVHWAKFLWGVSAMPAFLAEASLDATNLDVKFSHSLYCFRCARLRASGPRAELIAEGAEFGPSVGDEEFFATHEYRTTRFHVTVPECQVLGVSYGDMLQGKSYKARSVQFSGTSVDALVDRDKALTPFAKSPLMLYEALAAMRQTLEIDNLSVTNGSVKYCERMAVGVAPGVLTFAAATLSAEGIANRVQPQAAIQLHAQANFMDAGILKVTMSIPIRPADFSLHYSGSLSAMDLTRLNPFLEQAAYTSIKSGNAQEAAFDIDVAAGQARGRVQGIYTNLQIALLDKATGSGAGLDRRVVTLVANVLKIRKSNVPDASGKVKEGEVNYTRQPNEQFLQFLWFALRTGILDVVKR